MKTQTSVSCVFALVTLFLLGSSSKPSAASVHDVCVKSTDPVACADILNSDPQHATDDLVVIARIAVDKAVSNLTATDNEIKSLLSQANDPLLKRRLNQCLEYYDYAIFSCGRFEELVRDGDYEGINVLGGAIDATVRDCHQAFGSSPSPVRVDNSTFVLSEIMMITSIMLRGNVSVVPLPPTNCGCSFKIGFSIFYCLLLLVWWV